MAWADEQLFQDYSTDVMAQGDRWKIYLGRRLCLSYDDIDGSIFIEDLIDEIIHSLSPDRWITVKRQNVWITRPVEFPRDANGDDNDLEFDSDGYWVDPDEWYEDQKNKEAVDKGEMYEEDWIHDQAASRLNPLKVADEYDSDDDKAEDEEEMKMVEAYMEEAMESDSEWSVEDPTPKEKVRLGISNSGDADKENQDGETSGTQHEAGDQIDAMEVDGDENGTGSEEDQLDSDEPGSDWDSNDGIE